MSQGIALEGMRLVKDYLPRAYADGTDIDARANLMSAAAMGATAFQKGLGLFMRLATRSVRCTTPITEQPMPFVCLLSCNSTKWPSRPASTARPLPGYRWGFGGFVAFVDELNDSLGVPKRLRELASLILTWTSWSKALSRILLVVEIRWS